MTEFYRQRQQNMPYAQALRKAILKTMKNPEYLHPTYWSAFTLMGGV
jgi:CHAT domain-containing protein